MAEAPTTARVVLMGVAGSGKSTVGRALADTLGVAFVEADDLHSPAAKRTMAAGRPLDDAAREPWLDRVHARLALAARDRRGVVVACSALKPAYRARLTRGIEGVVFVALVATTDVLEGRLERRADHFAGPALLPSQLQDLDLDDTVTTVDASGPLDEVVAAAAAAVREARR